MHLITDLDRHDAIAWDFDQTLINNDHALLFHDYIRRTPHKQHVIITFRSGGLLGSLFAELAAASRPVLLSSHFVQTLGIAHERWRAWYDDDSRRIAGLLHGPLTEAERYYQTWKGMTCKALGLTVLVDDDPERSLLGCQEHGIEFLHSLEF